MIVSQSSSFIVKVTRCKELASRRLKRVAKVLRCEFLVRIELLNLIISSFIILHENFVIVSDFVLQKTLGICSGMVSTLH